MTLENQKNKEGKEQIKTAEQQVEKKVESQEDLEKQITELTAKLEATKKQSLENIQKETTKIDQKAEELSATNPEETTAVKQEVGNLENQKQEVIKSGEEQINQATEKSPAMEENKPLTVDKYDLSQLKAEEIENLFKNKRFDLDNLQEGQKIDQNDLNGILEAIKENEIYIQENQELLKEKVYASKNFMGSPLSFATGVLNEEFSTKYANKKGMDSNQGSYVVGKETKTDVFVSGINMKGVDTKKFDGSSLNEVLNYAMRWQKEQAQEKQKSIDEAQKKIDILKEQVNKITKYKRLEKV